MLKPLNCELLGEPQKMEGPFRRGAVSCSSRSFFSILLTLKNRVFQALTATGHSELTRENVPPHSQRQAVKAEDPPLISSAWKAWKAQCWRPHFPVLVPQVRKMVRILKTKLVDS